MHRLRKTPLILVTLVTLILWTGLFPPVTLPQENPTTLGGLFLTPWRMHIRNYQGTKQSERQCLSPSLFLYLCPHCESLIECLIREG